MKNERGSAAIEMTLMTPVLLILLLLVVAGGRLTNTRADIDAAARDGARSASVARSAGEARTAAEEAVSTALQNEDVRCASPQIDVRTDDFRPGGQVTVNVGCDVDLSDVTLLPVPSMQSLDAEYTEVVDSYRETTT